LQSQWGCYHSDIWITASHYFEALHQSDVFV
jgi:hypothetical protein